MVPRLAQRRNLLIRLDVDEKLLDVNGRIVLAEMRRRPRHTSLRRSQRVAAPRWTAAAQASYAVNDPDAPAIVLPHGRIPQMTSCPHGEASMRAHSASSRMSR